MMMMVMEIAAAVAVVVVLVVVDVVLPLLRQESQSLCSKSNHVKIFDVVENIYRSYHDRIVDIYNYD